MKEKTYTIQEVGKIYDLSVEALRYYEKSGIIFPITRKGNGHRVYFHYDLEWINFVNLLKSTGMSLSDIKKYKELVDLGDGTQRERLEIMKAHKQKILKQMNKLGEYLKKIDYKIDYYLERVE